ncbi:MAG: hemerythrin domain-containing protein [Tistlia sp.]|uniref:hemerythrin domain-containing protein n=1 Tax=Tistlia sp. TaxID=3057121 RepID=UPI0034A12795
MSPSKTSHEASQSDPISPAAALMAGKKVAPDATLLLEQEHREVEGYFAAYEAASDKKVKLRLIERICLDLQAHTTLEKEILYPVAREATGEDALLDHAEEEHAEAKEMVTELLAAAKAGKTPDQLVTKLRKAVEEHVEEEEQKLFPELREADLDLYALGRRLAARRPEVFGKLTGKPVPPQPEFKDYDGRM